VIAVDLRGHAHSDWEPPWDLDTHVLDLLETADALDVGVTDWMGHSFGGRLVLELAARAPDRVRRLVLLDPAIWVPPPRALELAEDARSDESFGSIEQAIDGTLARDGAAPAGRHLLEEELPEHLELGVDGRWRYRYSRAAVVAGYG
jgi:lipase